MEIGKNYISSIPLPLLSIHCFFHKPKLEIQFLAFFGFKLMPHSEELDW